MSFNVFNGGMQDPHVHAYMEMRKLAEQRRAAGIPIYAEQGQNEEYKRFAEEHKDKEMWARVAQNLIQGGANRGVPIYNKHEAQGRTGLVEPGLTEQQTTLPLPFNRAYEQTANLLAIVKSLPGPMFEANQRINQQVDQTIPQLQKALKQPSSIYDKDMSNYYKNRVNIALQRKRESSMYAIV